MTCHECALGSGAAAGIPGLPPPSVFRLAAHLRTCRQVTGREGSPPPCCSIPGGRRKSSRPSSAWRPSRRGRTAGRRLGSVPFRNRSRRSCKRNRCDRRVDRRGALWARLFPPCRLAALISLRPFEILERSPLNARTPTNDTPRMDFAFARRPGTDTSGAG